MSSDHRTMSEFRGVAVVTLGVSITGTGRHAALVTGFAEALRFRFMHSLNNFIFN